MRRLTRCLASLVIAVALWLCASTNVTQAAPDAAVRWDVPQLMSALRQVKSATARFVERKHLHMMDKPLEVSGTLLYLAPDQLQKITIWPNWERLAVKQNLLTIEQDHEGNARTFSLTDHAEIGAFVESIRATLAGDLPTLTRFYAVTIEGDAADWRLLLLPKERKLQDLVKDIRIGGTGNNILMVETEEADGDRSVMSIVEEDIR